jgi:hypothetical protein
MNLTNEVAAHQISTPATGQIQGRMICNGRNFAPITGENGARQELECDITWYTEHARMLLDVIVDINAGEKVLMTMWMNMRPGTLD